jgi:hypothetical protein
MKLLVIGDSLLLNQYASLKCMLQSRPDLFGRFQVDAFPFGLAGGTTLRSLLVPLLGGGSSAGVLLLHPTWRVRQFLAPIVRCWGERREGKKEDCGNG